MIEVQGLTKRYGAHTLFEHLSLTLHRGEMLALLGGHEWLAADGVLVRVLDARLDAAQAIRFKDRLREVVPPMGQDRYLAPELTAAAGLVAGDAFAAALAGRNDLEAPAIGIAPAVGEALGALLRALDAPPPSVAAGPRGNRPAIPSPRRRRRPARSPPARRPACSARCRGSSAR